MNKEIELISFRVLGKEVMLRHKHEGFGDVSKIGTEKHIIEVPMDINTTETYIFEFEGLGIVDDDKPLNITKEKPVVCYIYKFKDYRR